MATVVLVDDHDSQREIYELTLSTAGFVVHEAASGERAIEMIRVRRPDVVVLDLAMPKLDGWEVCRRLNRTPRRAASRSSSSLPTSCREFGRAPSVPAAMPI